MWSSARFFAVYPGHAPIAYEHTSFCGLLLLHINQRGSLMLVIPLQPEGTEKQRFCLQLKKNRVSLGSVQRGSAFRIPINT